MEYNIQMFLQLTLAFFLGAAVGLEREWRAKPAGLRTYALVSLGSCLFTLISIFGFSDSIGPGTTIDPARIAAQIVSGIGFLGAGIIFMKNDSVHGLTTAAGLWIAAAIGMATGVRMYGVAVFATFLSVLILKALTWVEYHLTKTKMDEPH